MRVKVLKFGGTSLSEEKSWQKVARWILSNMEQGFYVAVVVSAMGRKSAPYSTDALINLAKAFCEEISARDLDLIVSCGELIAAVVMSGVLRAAGQDAAAFTGRQAGIITNDNFGDARIQRVDPSALFEAIEEGKVPVVAGFQGATEDGEITSLGRGGSDITAAALGVAMKAEMVEIFTDVNGIKTADPRLVPQARTIGGMSYEEICQLAEQGAKVVHPRACQIAMSANIPLRVRSTFEEEPGTLVTNGSAFASRAVTGVAQMPGVTQLTVSGDQKKTQKIFDQLAAADISIDLINVSPGLIVFTIPDDNADKAADLLEGEGYEVMMRPSCAKVSVVGSGMRGLPGVMAKIVKALNNEEVEILQTCDSHFSINCLVPGNKMAEAVRALHSVFELDRKGGDKR